MGYDEDDSMIRVDFFKESGKWYTTEAIKWNLYSECLIQDAFRDALETHLKGRLSGLMAVCLDPYHEHAHPLMIKVN